MNGHDLKQEQVARLLAAIEPTRAYLATLTARMQKRSFDHADPLWQRALDAERALVALTTELRSLRLRLGKPPK